MSGPAEIASAIAAWVAVGLSVWALLWQRSSQRIDVRVRAGMNRCHRQSGGAASGPPFLAIRVTNHGGRTTTLTGIGLLSGPDGAAPKSNMFEEARGIGSALPFALEPGRHWDMLLEQTQALHEFAKDHPGFLLRVAHSLGRGRSVTCVVEPDALSTSPDELPSPRADEQLDW